MGWLRKVDMATATIKISSLEIQLCMQLSINTFVKFNLLKEKISYLHYKTIKLLLVLIKFNATLFVLGFQTNYLVKFSIYF